MRPTDAQTLIASPGPSAPGFIPPITGYEFELNHSGNLLELRRQKQWAQAQLCSCNENNRFKHTQTTACIVAVNGSIVGPYRADSLRCFGTNPEIPGLRVTMTVNEGDTSDANNGGEDSAEMPVFRKATLVLRYQIIITHQARTFHQQARQEFPPLYMMPQPSRTTSVASVMSSGSHHSTADNASLSSMSTRTRTNTIQSTASSSIGGGTASTAPSIARGHSISPTMPGVSSTTSTHQQGRRYLFATTTIPLRGGVAARPGYRPVEAGAAAERIRQWGGTPDKHVFGNSWLIHMAIEPGHVQHKIFPETMEQVQRLTGRRSGGDYGGNTDAVQTMIMVNEQMGKLVAREGTLSVMLSNHMTQKRIARQCPDLVAMWVMAQENL